MLVVEVVELLVTMAVAVVATVLDADVVMLLDTVELDPVDSTLLVNVVEVDNVVEVLGTEVELVEFVNNVLVRVELFGAVVVGNAVVLEVVVVLVEFEDAESVHTLSFCPAPQYSSCEPEHIMLHWAESITGVLIVLPQ